jgi:DNA polymerase-3 subunit delta
MVPLTRTGVIFEISQALESKKTDRAIKLIDFQMEKGENAITIIRSCFIPTIRRLLLAKLLNEQFSLSRFNYKELNAKLLVLPPDLKALTTAKNGTPQTFAIFNALKWAASFKKDRLKLILKECMKADKSLVSTSENPQMILHRLAIIMAF